MDTTKVVLGCFLLAISIAILLGAAGVDSRAITYAITAAAIVVSGGALVVGTVGDDFSM